MKPFLTILSFLLITSVKASLDFSKVEDLYARQDFHQVVDTLDEMKPITKTDKAQVEYFRGLALKGMGDYQGAAEAYEKSIKFGIERPDIQYEYGQALYGANALEEAQGAFKKSAAQGFKKDISHYYIAYTHQLLEQYKKAKVYYARVLKDPQTTKEMRQIANFQLAEVFYQLATPKEDPKRLIKKYVLPQFTKAITVDPNSSLADDIRQRELEVKRRFGLDPNTLINGRRLPKKRYQLSFSQAFAYDSNITLATDLTNIELTQRDSYVLTSSAKGNYTLAYRQRFLIKPELKIRNVHHTNQDEPIVFRNDTYTISPALRTSFEHRVGGKAASFFLDYDHSYVARDADLDKSVNFYARSNQLTLGEKFRFFSFGDTTIKAQYRDYDAFTPVLSSRAANFGIDQVAVLPNRHLLLGLFLASVIRSDNPINELNYYLLRFDYLIPEIFPKYTLHVAHGLSILDSPDAALDAARGIEFEFNPSIRMTKKVTQKFSVSFGHSFTKRTSDDETNRVFSKHVSDFELRYNF